VSARVTAARGRIRQDRLIRRIVVGLTPQLTRERLSQVAATAGNPQRA